MDISFDGWGRLFKRSALAAAALALAACSSPSARLTGPATASASGGSGASAVAVQGPLTIGLLAPLRGSEAQISAGRDLKAAAEIAVAELGGDVELAVYDTGATPAGAAAAAAKAAAEGVEALIGPAYAQEAEAIKPVLARTGLRALAFSPFAGAAGSGVYVMGFTPEAEAEAMLGYAASRGLTRPFLMKPATQYGAVVESALRAAAPRFGATLAGVTPYERSKVGIEQASSLAAQQLAASGADSAFLVDRGQGLVAVAAFLNYRDAGPNRYRYLGLSGWETGATFREPSLAGGWFAAPDPSLRSRFAAKFQQRVGRAPYRDAVLAYDAVRALAALKPRLDDGLDDADLRSQGFAGAGGAFRFGPDAVARRSVAVLEVGENAFVTLAPASSTPAGGS